MCLALPAQPEYCLSSSQRSFVSAELEKAGSRYSIVASAVTLSWAGTGVACVGRSEWLRRRLPPLCRIR